MSSLFAAEVVGMSQVVGCTAVQKHIPVRAWTIKSTQGRPCGPLQAAVLGRRQHYDAWTALLPFVRNVVILGHACAHDWLWLQPSCVAVMAWDQGRGWPCCGRSMPAGVLAC